MAGEILRCASCGLGFTTDRPSEAELSSLYQDMSVDVYRSERRAREATARRHLRVLNRFHNRGKLLDVGCASGMFIATAKSGGWSVLGIEPNAQLATEARQRIGDPLSVLQTTVEACEPNLGFDAITLWDVLEHVRDPVTVLSRCAKWLRTTGVIIANVPDLQSIQSRLLGQRWPLLLPEHLNYFTKRALEVCGAKAGLSVAAFGRRPVTFGLQYVTRRLRDHQVWGADCAHRMVSALRLGNTLVSLPLGELYAVWNPINKQQNDY